ncbi:acyltransferase domain-containing protein, partial [Mycobacterium szulgai]|uniref:acyltransferase domain-containing protein n=1 Tax=Mycobacterium szulgai TaxID=1787 RepID=UPI0021F38065
HSQGEIAAAYVAGGLSLEDAAKVVALRSQAIAELAGLGGMAAIGLPAAQVDERVARYGGRVSVAALNSPASTVVSGDPGALDELVAACAAQGVFARRIPVDYASHSAQVEAVEQRLVAQLAGISPRAGTVAFYSTVTGAQLGTEALDGRYWYANLRQPVQFEQTTRVLIEQGCRALIEMGPHPVLAVAMTETAEASGADAVAVLGSLRREEGDWRRFVTCLAEAHVAGVGVDWAAVFAPWRPRRVELPTYAFQRQRYWLSGRSVGDVASVGLDGAGHALLGAVVAQPESGGVVLTGRLSLAAQPWLADHVVGGVVLFPGTGFVELAIRAGDEVGCGVIEELTLGAPLVVPDKDEVRIQVVVGGVGEFGGRPVSVYSRGGAADSGWVLHAEGRLGAGGVTGPAADLSVWPPAGAVSVDVSDGYERLAGRGYLYGRAFRGLRSLWRRGEELFAEVDVPEDARVGLGGFGLHPVVFDAALHAVALAVDDLEISVPFAWEQVSLHAAGAGAVRARIAPVRSGAMSVELADGAGGPVLSVGSLTMRPVTVGQLESAAAGGGGGASRLFEVKWVAAPVVDERPAAVSVLSWEGFRQSVIAPDASDVPDAVVFEVLEVPGGVVAGVYTAIHQVLAVVQSWLAQPVGGVLVVVTVWWR